MTLILVYLVPMLAIVLVSLFAYAMGRLDGFGDGFRQGLWAAQNDPQYKPHQPVEDGLGGLWPKCSENCSLHVVRPGKVQCNRDCAECPSREETR